MGLGQGDQHGQGGCVTPPGAVEGQSSQVPLSWFLSDFTGCTWPHS